MTKERVKGFISEKEERKQNIKYRFRELRTQLANVPTTLRKKVVTWWSNAPVQPITSFVTSVTPPTTIWLFEAVIEGLVINIPATVFFRSPINFYTIIAYGIIVKKSLEYLKNIHDAVRREPIGHSSNTVPQEHQRDRRP